LGKPKLEWGGENENGPNLKKGGRGGKKEGRKEEKRHFQKQKGQGRGAEKDLRRGTIRTRQRGNLFSKVEKTDCLEDGEQAQDSGPDHKKRLRARQLTWFRRAVRGESKNERQLDRGAEK